MKTLYKKDTKGKIRFWTIYTKGSEIIQEAGVVGTDSPIINTKVAKPKNVGRANATTAEEQAISEMESAINKKVDKGHFETIEEAENEVVILPMLAKDFNKEKKKIDWDNCFVQPKLDGMRCLAVIKDGNVTLLSRGGKEIETLNHIAEQLKDLPDCILDGEVYAHGYNFQENMRMIKKYREGETEKVKYHVYDMVSDESFVDRFYNLVELTSDIDQLELVSTYNVNDEEEIKEFHADFLSIGFEGTIVRHGDVGYKLNGRSSNLLKYKDFIDIALPLKDVVEGEQRPEWGMPVFELDGKEFKTGTRLSHEERIDLLFNKDQYIGKTAEIRFFEYSEDGIPRFPVLVGFRLDK